MSQVSYAVQDGVAVLTLDNPPVNGLGHELRTGLVAGLDRALGDPAVRAVVLTGAGKAFSGGADIKEFDSPRALAEPNLHTVIRAVEQSPKPVVAAIHAVCMGGGLELALACHYRVAAPGAQVALPEVKLGLLPGAGGTQRLPRAVGLETALNMIVSGAPVPSEKLVKAGLFDELVEGDLVAGATAFARKVAGKRPLPLVRDRKVEHRSAQGFIGFARNTAAAVAKDYPAPHRCIDAIEAAVEKPFEEGLRVERELFLQLMFTPESRALRHAFFAERAASKIPDVPEDTPTRPIKLAAVIGAGTMGGGIAMNFANAGIPVKVLEVKEEALQKGIGVVRKNYEGSAKKGKLTAEQVQERMGRIQPTLDYAAIGDADIVVEAVFEDMAVKEQVFKKLDQVMKPGAILATNTSTLDVNAIAGFTRRPQDVVGTHFFSPANVMKLLEIVRGARTGKDVLATVMGLSKKMKKTGVVSGVCDGFIGNRMLEQYLRQCLWLLEEGALPQQVDRALEKFGWVMGPFRVSDLAGNDVGWYIRKRRYVERPDVKYSRIADQICEQGRFGQKTGAGWYRYETGKRDALPDPAVEATIVAYRQKIGIAPREISDDEIVHRCAWALVNEAAQLLEEGIAQRASDIDMVYLTGYGFPVYRGGPMRYADEVGLYNVVRAMKRFGENPHGDPGFWKPAPLLARLAAEGKSFTGKGE
ncbi:MAG: enoyl-CoA hydratase/isomerase family protein [Deltaproteobacteria bacterium]|nr:enoyl-CoA hydratase/isomerase family protein [Deltaproteobacteria bacterium]